MAADATSGRRLPNEVLTDLVEDSRRRRILRCLAAEGPMTVRTLARRIAAAEADQSPAAVSEATVDSLARTLYDDHIPKLTATGVVEYDSLRASLCLVDGGVRDALPPAQPNDPC